MDLAWVLVNVLSEMIDIMRFTPDGCSRMSTYGLGRDLAPSIRRSNQREDALHGLNGWLAGKQKADHRLSSLRQDAIQVLKAVSIKRIDNKKPGAKARLF